MLIPENGYYLETIEDGREVLLPCYQSCKTCHEGGNEEDHKCDECKESLFKENIIDTGDTYSCDCVDHCEPGHLYRDRDLECVENCESGEYQDEGKCVTSCGDKIKEDNSQRCVEICANYIFIEDNEKKCVNSCDSNNYIRDLPNNQKGCLKTCSSYYTVETVGSTEMKKCLDDCQNYQYILKVGDAPYKCVDSCSYYKNGNECVEQCPNYSYQTDCYNTCPSGKYTINDDLNKKCVDSCQDESGYKVFGTQLQCVKECTAPFSHLIPSENRCTDICPDFISEDEKECVSDCNGLLQDPSTKKCVSSCNNNPINTLKNGNICVQNCPEGFKEKNGECLDLHISSIDGNNAQMNLDFDNAITFINEIITELADGKKTIKGNDFIAQLFNINSPPEKSTNISSIDFTKLEPLIRQKYSIPDNEDLIIAKYDIIKENSLTNDVEYKIFREDGTELTLDGCENVDILISYPINPNSELNLRSAQKLIIDGIDVFNSSDPFFNDPCSHFEVNSSDVVLKDRRYLYYQNATFCSANCEYKGIDYDTLRVQCECSTQPNQLNNIDNINEFPSEIVSTNLYLTKCIKEFIKVKQWPSDIGFWFILCIVLFEISSLLILKFFDMNFLFSELNKQQKSSPPSTTNDISDEEYFYHVKKFINEKYKCTFDKTIANSTDTLRETDVKKLTVKEIENDLNHETEDLLRLYSTHTSDVDNYPYQVALILDKKNCFDIFLKINKESNLLFRSIFIKSKYELVSLNICYFLFFLGLLFTINAVFYNDDLISKKLFDIATIADIFFRMLLALIVTFVIMKIVSYFKYYAPFFDMLEIEVKDCDVLGEHIRKRINDIKCKMITFYSIIVSCTLFFLYYLTIFCIVYKT